MTEVKPVSTSEATDLEVHRPLYDTREPPLLEFRFSERYTMMCHVIHETVKVASRQFSSVVPPKEVLFLNELGRKRFGSLWDFRVTDKRLSSRPIPGLGLDDGSLRVQDVHESLPGSSVNTGGCRLHCRGRAECVCRVLGVQI